MNILEARRRLLGADVKKKTAEGNPISVRSLARMYPRIEMEGWTEQVSTTGAQLLDVESMKQVSSWIGTGAYKHLNIDLKPNTTYTIFVRQNNMNKGYNPEYDDDFAFYLGELENGASTNFMFGNTTSPNINVKQYTFTTTDKPYYINLYISPWSEEKLAIAFDELLVDIMLVEGGSVVPYEPYTGNQPSPSPDYPQEIVSAGEYNEETQKWGYEVKLQGKNLFDFSKVISNGASMSVDYEKQTITIPARINNVGYMNTFRDVVPDAMVGMTCVINAKNSNPEAGRRIYLLNTKKTIYFGLSFEITDDLLSDYFAWYNNQSTNNENIISEIQIEYGDTSTDYEPYKEPQTVTLQSDRPLTKYDRLEKRDGQWGWVFRGRTLELTGEEDFIGDGIWGNADDYRTLAFYCNATSLPSYKSTGRYETSLSNYFVGKLIHLVPDVTGMVTSKDYISFRLPREVLPDWQQESPSSEPFKNWLKAKAETEPVKVVYESSEEEWVPLTDPEQAALNALHTNYPTTVLVNDQGCNMKLTYKTKKSLEVTT